VHRGPVEPGRLPTEEQSLMLRAALLPGSAGLEAGRTWLATADIQRLGKASRGLLPMLYERFRKEGLDGPIMPVLKGVRRHAWYNNRLLFHHGAQAIDRLREAGIEVMVLKGAAMVTAYHHDASLRPMEDLDILVHHQDARSAVSVLQAQGWAMRRGAHRSAHYFEDGLYAVAKGCDLVHRTGIHLDLHWNLLGCGGGAQADEVFWAAAADHLFEGRRVKVLASADQLLHTLVHGAAWSTLSPVRWIPDAMTVLACRPDLDWDRLVRQARVRAFALIVSDALHHLDGHFGGVVPRNVFDTLGGEAPRFLERIERWNITRAGTMGPARLAVAFMCDFLRHSGDRPLPDRLRMFPDYMRHRAGAEDLSRLVVNMAGKLARHLRGSGRR
jgi:hypothetical protein